MTRALKHVDGKFLSGQGSDLKSDREELAYALLIGAMMRKERANPFGVPRVGHSVDRRTLLHLGETFQEDKVKCLMCFVCRCKHLFHYGYDKFGRDVSKGEIDYMQRGNDGDLFNLPHGGQDGKALDRAFEVNLSRKKFKSRYGAAVANDESFANDTWEWKRLTMRSGQLQEVMCNPEDVDPCSRHDSRTVCSNCRIPICNECRRLTHKNQPIPKALANDNFIGYMMRNLVDHKVTWLEKTIASPVFIGIIS